MATIRLNPVPGHPPGAWLALGRFAPTLLSLALLYGGSASAQAPVAVEVSYAYDANGRLVSATHAWPDAEPYAIVYGYDAAGNITRVVTGGPEILSADTPEDLPKSFALGAGYPNPFNPSITIPVDVPRSAPVRIEIFDVLGRLMTVLVDRVLEPGRQSVRWDGVGAGGVPVSGGLYFVRMRTPGFRALRGIVLLK